MAENKINFNYPSIKTVDQALFKYVEDLGITTYTNKGQVKVPVIWTGAERSFQIKNNATLRDQNGVLILPQIAVARTSMSKSLTWKGSMYGIIPEVADAKGGVVTIARRIGQKKNSEFKRADSTRSTGQINFKGVKKEDDPVVYEYISMPLPTYLDMQYEFVIRTEYQSQMNEIMEPFLVRTGGSKAFVANYDGWDFECFYEESLGTENNIANFDEKERIFKSKFTVKALGYIIGEQNQEKPKRVIRENAIKIALEERIVNNINEE